MLLSSRHDAAAQKRRCIHAVERYDAVHHGHVDVLAAPGFMAVMHRRQDADDAVHGTGCHIGDLHVGQHRPRLLASRVGHVAGPRKIVDVVPRAHGHRPCLPVAGQRAVDQPRVQLLQLLVAQTKFVHDAGPELLQQDIVSFVSDEAFDRFHARLRLQIQHDGFLVPPDPRGNGRHAGISDLRRPLRQDVRTARRGDADDLCAHIRHDQRRVRPRK